MASRRTRCSKAFIGAACRCPMRLQPGPSSRRWWPKRRSGRARNSGAEEAGDQRLAAWPDLEIRQAGRGILIRARAPRFDRWWHERATWEGDPMGSIILVAPRVDELRLRRGSVHGLLGPRRPPSRLKPRHVRRRLGSVASRLGEPLPPDEILDLCRRRVTGDAFKQ